MTRTVITTEPSRTLQSAARSMREGRFRHLPVVSRGRLVGIISDRDVVAQREGQTVREVMHENVISVTPDTPIDMAAELMLDNKIGALPVVERGGGAVAGIVTQSDLFEVLARTLGGDRPSTRLALRLTDLAGELAMVTTLAHERRVRIESLVTLPGNNRETSRRVVLRVGTIAAAAFANALRDAGLDVDAPDEHRSAM
jgi:acetoin utilization protein AcuB